MRTVLLLALLPIAFMTFGFGMLGPLTPSEGSPTTWYYLHYLGLPITLVALGLVSAISNARLIWRAIQTVMAVLALSGGTMLLVVFVRMFAEGKDVLATFQRDKLAVFLFVGGFLLQLIEITPAVVWLIASSRYIKRLPRHPFARLNPG